MKYSTRRHGKCYKIFETESKRYITWSLNKKKIDAITANLNAGGGFDGSIPGFFLSSVDPKKGFKLEHHQKEGMSPAY